MPCEERDLWLSVILRAFNDAAIKNVNPMDKEQANKWLLDGGIDFQLVCYFAGVNPNKVKEHFLKIKDKNHDGTRKNTSQSRGDL